MLHPLYVEQIDRLLEQNYDLKSMLEFIDEYEPEDTTFEEVYQEYVAAGENYGFEVVDAFLTGKVGDLDQLERLGRIYVGEFIDRREMAEAYCSYDVESLPYYIAIDWEDTADMLIDDGEVIRVGNHYFSNDY
jgi:hypothetical protein